jgi:hypothetical protein
MALVDPKRETRNPLPVGRFFVVLNPDRVQDFNDWAAIYAPKKLVSIIASHAAPSFFGGSDQQVTFEVHKPDVAFWWANVFAGMPINLSESPRVVAPSVDRAQRAIERPIEAASSAASAASSALASVGPLVVVGLLLYLYLQSERSFR